MVFFYNSGDHAWQPLLVSSQPFLDFLDPWEERRRGGEERRGEKRREEERRGEKRREEDL